MYSRVVIAATGSGAGKTTITCGILRALKAEGKSVCSFKCGPDYIDPMFHRNVLGVASGNLDTFFTEEEVTRALFMREFTGELAVIEGVMGLYDGVGGTQLVGSTYDLARTLKAPIVLVVNGRGMGRSILAEIKGFLDYDTDGLIQGVILNKVSKSFAASLKSLIEEELHIKVVGSVENNASLTLTSRHLGLVMPNEIDEIKEKLELAKQAVTDGIDLDAFVEIAGNAASLSSDYVFEDIVKTKGLKLAIARDEAFCFYYKENIEMLESSGVEIEYFSPLHDEHLPKGISGILLGGGYPENFLKELSDNESMRAEIKAALESKMPILAECGGFMYLMDSIKDKDGNAFDMVGAIPGTCEWQGKLVRFGYVTIEKDSGEPIKGHEFHYYDTDNNGEDLIITKPSTGKSIRGMHAKDGSYIGYPHLYYPSSPAFVKDFVEVMKSYGRD